MSDASNPELDNVLAEVLNAEAAGQPVDREALFAKHPAIAGELASFFRNWAAVERLAEPLRQAAGEPTLGIDVVGAGPGARVRYIGDYELIEEIARGGMGVVYKAKQTSLGRIVALKMIVKGELASEAEVQRFRQEAEAAAKLDHPNIVPIFEIGEHQGQQYFSMRLIETATQTVKPTPRDWAARLAKVARAVHHAHQRGILHRDLKPGNILIDAAGEPHVADFGLAKKVDGGDAGETASGATRSGAIVGTPAYMAPEQARAEKPLTTAVDVYSLGAVLYEWLTGRPPFRGEDALTTLMKVVSDDPAKPRSLDQSVDRDLETICLKCLDKDPAKRYGSAEALADDLERWLRGEPILARRASGRERLVKWARRQPMAAALVAASIFFMVSFIGALAYFVLSLNKAVEAEHAARLKTVAALLRENRVAYAQRVNLAHREWLADNVLRAEQILDDCPEELRGWEWHYLKRLCHGERYAIPTPGAVVGDMIITTDGKALLTIDSKGDVVWYDARTGREQKRRTLDTGKVGRCAFSPDGRRLAVAPEGKDVLLWDLDTGEKPQTFKGHTDQVYSVSFSPDGGRLATTGGDGMIRIWDVADGSEKKALAGHKHNHVQCVAFSPDGKRLVSASGAIFDEGEVKVWDIEAGKILHSLAGHREVVFVAAFSPDGQTIASAGWDKTVRLWDAATGKELVVARGIPHLVSRLVFTPAGDALIVSGQSDVIRVLDTKTGVEKLRVRGYRDNVIALALGPDGQSLAASAGRNLEKLKGGEAFVGEIRLWDLALGQECQTSATPSGVVTFSPDGASVAFAPMLKKFADIIDARTGLLAFRLEHEKGQVSTVAFSPDGRRVVTAAGTMIRWGGEDAKVDPGEIMFWDMANAQRLAEIATPEGVIDAMVFRPGREQFATVGRDGVIRLRDGLTGKEIKILGPGEKLGSPAFSPNGALLAAWSNDRTVTVWDVDSGELKYRFRGHQLSNGRLAFSPDGRRLASCGFDPQTVANFAESRDTSSGELKLWDLATGKETTPFPAKVDAMQEIVFTRDGTRLAAVCTSGAVKLWDVESGQETLTLRGHSGSGFGVAISPDGRRIASASWLPRIFASSSGEVKVWDATPLGTHADERIAAGIVAGLFAREGLGDAVRAELTADKSLDATTRKMAMEIAGRLREDEGQLNDLSWEIIRLPTRSAEDYRRALEMIDTAHKRKPNNRFYINTLGVAQYRIGQYENAIKSLTLSNERNAKDEGGSNPWDVAFLALSYHRLDRETEARKHRDQLRELMKRANFASDPDLKGFLAEVEAALR